MSGTLVSFFLKLSKLSDKTRDHFLLLTRTLSQDYAYDFDLSVSEGDIIQMTVTATSETTGNAVIENETTGSTVTYTFDGDVEASLCLTNAEWIVEDVSLNNIHHHPLLPFLLSQLGPRSTLFSFNQPPPPRLSVGMGGGKRAFKASKIDTDG